MVYLSEIIKPSLTMVYLSEIIKPSFVAKASESILVCSSDVDEAIYMITLEIDGVVVKGNVNVFSRYPDWLQRSGFHVRK